MVELSVYVICVIANNKTITHISLRIADTKEFKKFMDMILEGGN